MRDSGCMTDILIIGGHGKVAMLAAPLTNALLHGSLRRYRSIPGETVARAIVALAGRSDSGVQIHENDAIRALAD